MAARQTGSNTSTASALATYDIYRLNPSGGGGMASGIGSGGDLASLLTENSLANSSSFVSSSDASTQPQSANNSNSNLFTNTLMVAYSSQSTFQLKVSIISAEVKNIVNILKQVSTSLALSPLSGAMTNPQHTKADRSLHGLVPLSYGIKGCTNAFHVTNVIL